VRHELFIRGLYTRVLGEVICLAPPLVISEQEIDHIADIVKEAIPAAGGFVGQQ
jgi:adenosylmethionine-8-amino-7-oxononanoate aminotransferase